MEAMRHTVWMLLTVVWLAAPGSAAAEEMPAAVTLGRARVQAPVADLRKEPIAPKSRMERDPLEESQLLAGDPVMVLEIQGEWARVSAVNQQEWTHNRRWEGYPGWMRVLDLAPEPAEGKPTPANVPDPATVREQIVKAARGFLDASYYWGGRSPQAVDCSGLTGLSYQTAGVAIPRDAHEQWMKARPIVRENLQPGDLVFLADPQNAHRITHVMLCVGGDEVIEAPGTGTTVREISLEERLKGAQDRRVYYGRYVD